MKAPYFSVVLAVVALTLASACNPCQAGSITYDFVEGINVTNPVIGATITFSVPPASPTTPWSTDALPDFLGVQIIDPKLFLDHFTGSFILTSQFQPSVASSGPDLTSLVVGDTHNRKIFALPMATAFYTGIQFRDVLGTWKVSTAVPEPASGVQAGIASAIGMALAAFRKRKEARRQRPVGPLDANQ